METLNRHLDAIDFYELSLQIEPDNSANWYSVGMLHKKLGKVDKALPSFEKAL